MPILLSVFFSLIVFSYSSWGQNVLNQQARIQGITVQAESMDRDSDKDTVEVAGSVQIIYKDQHLSADRARINFRAKSIEAFGNVLVTTPQANISGQHVVLDYETNTGLIIDGYVQSGNVLFEGSTINKLSETEYIADDARYTTCTTCPEAWSFSGTKIRAEIGGYAYIKNSFLKFASVPVFWLPYLAVPLKSDRQSGLLTPSFGSSEAGGFEGEMRYFWAKSRSDDATITLLNYEKRGLKTLVNYRYVLTENSSGSLDLGFLKDKVYAQDPRLNDFRPSSQRDSVPDRYFIRYSHYYEMPEGLIHRAQINNTSDLQYPKDFARETNNLGDTAMENRTSLTKNTKTQHYSMDMSYYKNMMQSDPNAGNDDAVHRLPELKFSQVQTRMGDSDFLYSVDLDYVNFVRPQSYDDLNAGYDSNSTSNDRWINSSCGTKLWEQSANCNQVRDGTFDSKKDLIRTGQRLDFKPTIYRPFKLNNFEFLPKMTYQETKYEFPVGEDTHAVRRLFRADLSAKTTFSRIYGDFSYLQSSRIKHEMQPEIYFTAVPWAYQPKNSFFGYQDGDSADYAAQPNITDTDLNGPTGIQFDYNDRLINRRLVTFAFTNKLTRKSWEDGQPAYLQFLIWKLAQSYDAYQAEKNPSSQPLSELSSDLQLTLAPISLSQTANYYPYTKETNTTTRVRATAKNTDFIEIQQALTTTGSRNEEWTYTVKKTTGWMDLIGKLIYDESPNIKKVKSWGYGAQIKPPGECFVFKVTQFRVTGDKNIQTKVSFDFVWDGDQILPPSDSILKDIGF